MAKLLPNLPITELNSETDYLNIINKGELIVLFLQGNKNQFENIKMFSLYGDWGSGKSSLMKYIQTHLSEDFNTFFFEAWEFEKSDNLALSLLEFLTLEKNKGTHEDAFDSILDIGGRILRGLGKSVKFSTGILPGGEVQLTPLVEELSKKKELPFYKALEKFKTDFIMLEDAIIAKSKTKGKNKQYNIVFIDDLDRCEPEQVLNLLSAVKLFFTYGKKTIFFCGIDKKAVEEAVRTKYGEVVKASEYLEKIFDISFSMPENEDVQKMVNYYFDTTSYKFSLFSIPINKRIHDFFQYIEFTNPRRIKKVLNKLQILRNIKSLNKFKVFPNIDVKNGKVASFPETILTLYLIILHEFYSEYFHDFLNMNSKKGVYHNAFMNSSFLNKSNIKPDSLNKMLLSGVHQKPFKEWAVMDNDFSKFNICFAPSKMQEFTLQSFSDKIYIDQMIVGENKIEYLFYRYIMHNEFSSNMSADSSELTLLQLKQLIRNAL